MDQQHKDINLSLDEIIQLKRVQTTITPEMAALSLDEYIKVKQNDLFEERMKSVETEAPKSFHDYRDMTLDEIIYEKKIIQKITGANQIVPRGVPDDSTCSPSTSEANGVVLKALDPCTTSLDDLIEKPGAHAQPKRKSHSMDKKDEPSSAVVMNMGACSGKFPRLTPYRAVGFMSEGGMIIDVSIGRHRQSHNTGDQSHKWRCVVSCGGIRAIADSFRKVVAREMACREFLTQLRVMYKDAKIPEFEVPDELFIDPRLFHNLEKEGVKKALTISNEVRVKPVRPQDPLSSKRHIHYSYVCTYMVEKDKFVGENFVIEYAKLLAARAAYIHITGKEPRPTKYFTGVECDPDLEYDETESEVFQSLTRNVNPALSAIPDDPEEAKIELARREVCENFKKARKEEVERRRNLPVDVVAFEDMSFMVPNEMDIDPQVDNGEDESEEKKATGRGRGRGLIRRILGKAL